MQNRSSWRAMSPGYMVPLCIAIAVGAARPAHANDDASRSAAPLRVADIVATDERSMGFQRGHEDPVLKFNYPGATFLRLHFAMADIGDDAEMLIANGDRSEVHRVKRADILRDSGNGGYYAMSLSGDEVTVHVVGGQAGDPYALHVDKVDVGFGDLMRPLNIIGQDQRERAVCLKERNPDVYRRAQSVARVYGHGYYGTAWRVGPGNHMLTNHHVIGNDQNPKDFEIWFGYEHDRCVGSHDTTKGNKIRGDRRLAGAYELDFQLFTLDPTVFSSGQLAQYGYLGLDISPLGKGTPIYIPQHGGGNPRQIATISDNGETCVIIATPGVLPAFQCDIEGGSSGSPVIDRRSHRVRALVRSGFAEYNQGVGIEYIWPRIQSHFPGGIPGGG